jgi:hypothetical protein
MSSFEESRQRRQDALVSFTQECGQNVFADAFAPQVVAAVAAWVRKSVEVDPMFLGSPNDAVTAGADTLSAESETPLQSIEVDATCGVEVDHQLVIHDAPNPGGLSHSP